jgi:hypothetical protein
MKGGKLPKMTCTDKRYGDYSQDGADDERQMRKNELWQDMTVGERIMFVIGLFFRLMYDISR